MKTITITIPVPSLRLPRLPFAIVSRKRLDMLMAVAAQRPAKTPAR
jgi:hypothetical protein